MLYIGHYLGVSVVINAVEPYVEILHLNLIKVSHSWFGGLLSDPLPRPRILGILLTLIIGTIITHP